MKIKLLIQLNFQNGLGNLYCGVVQLLHFANYYKELGYECNFIFASKNAGGNGWSINNLCIEELFDMDSFDVFNTITNLEYSIVDKEYNGYTYYGSGTPGVSWWDVFFSGDIDIFHKLSYENHDKNIFLSKEFIPKKIPKFNSKINEKVNKFKLQSPQIDASIQLRLFGFGDKENYNPSLVKFYDDLYELIKKTNKKFFLTSSCVSCLGELLNLPNIFLIDSRISDDNKGDTTIFDNRDTILNFLYDNIAEMILISETDIVYHKTVLSWTSTYLYYSFVNNPNMSILPINNL